MKNPADKVEQWDINKLVPYARNSRTHSDEQVAQIAASIKEWGFTTAVLVDEQGGIIAGHGRTLAAQRLQMKEVPVMVAAGWSDAKKRAYIIADNKLALNAGWDFDMLRFELTDIGGGDFNLDLLGFDDKELADLIGDAEVIGLPELPDGDKSVLEQITFTLHREQADTIKNALAVAKKDFDITTEINDNSNGNAIAFIAELFITQNVS
jgi:ParB family chromosome partitioning protein